MKRGPNHSILYYLYKAPPKAELFCYLLSTKILWFYLTILNIFSDKYLNINQLLHSGNYCLLKDSIPEQQLLRPACVVCQIRAPAPCPMGSHNSHISIFHFLIFTFEFKFHSLTFAQNFGNTLF